MATPNPSGTRRGWALDRINGRLSARYNDTEFLRGDATGVTVPGTFTATGASTLTGAQTLTGITTHSDEVRIANGKNLRIGTIGAFATTEPTNAIVMFQGTEFAGAITTSGGLMSSATVVRKVIAAGTVSNVET